MLSASFAAALPPPALLHSVIRQPNQSQPDLEPIHRRIQQAIARGAATGVAIAVAHNGRIALEEGFGWANREAGIKVTPHTPFSMASITKPFTATALMTLVAEGKLNLDAPANNYLANSRLIGVDGNAAAATVRHLGAHVSGLPSMFEAFDQGEANLALSPDALLREYGRLAYPPGLCYEYSNLGFAGLDAIASHLAGSGIGTLVQQRVLSPLGLHDSFFDTSLARLPSAALRYDPLGHPIPFYTTSTPASGELYASAHDLALFALFTMKQRVAGQKQVLNDGAIDDLLKPVFTGPTGVATTFGWFTGHLKSGTPFVFKSGGQAGVATILYMVPAKNLACLVLTNQSNARELAVGVCDQLAQSYVAEWQQPQETSGPEPTPFVATPAFLGQWAGTLAGGGAFMPARLTISSNSAATLALGTHAPESITGLHAEAEALTGNTAGRIDSPDALRTRATALALKLLPHTGKLVGRVLATAGDPNFKNVRLPFVLTFDRVSG